jgi:cytosine deaminase
MLVLSRQRDQSVMIGDDTEVRVVDVRGDKVRLGFIAPRDVSVHRKEVYDQIRRENQSAAQVMPEDLGNLNKPAVPPPPKMRLVPVPSVHTKEDETFLRAAIDEAKAGLAEGGVPIGSVLVRGGQVIARGHNRRVQHGDPMAHAEIDCLTKAGRQHTYADTTLYSTLIPCFLCSGAAVQFGIKRVVIGESANFPGGRGPGGTSPDFLRHHGVDVVDLNDAECTELMAKFIHDHPDLWNEDIGR